MRLRGDFVSRQGVRYSVEITTKRAVAEDVAIDGGAVAFAAEDAVEVGASVNGVFDHALRHSATIRLQTSRYLPGLFCANCLESRVKVKHGETVVFAGWVEPMAYAQEFNSVADDLELNCIDSLSALQYGRYLGVGSAGVTWAGVRTAAGNRTLLEIVKGALDSVSGGETYRLWYDGSRDLPGYSGNIFAGIEVSDLLLLGESEDETWTQLEAVEETLRYLNLHIEQTGTDYRIFDWRTRGESGARTWTDLLTGNTMTETGRETTFSSQNVEGRETQLTIGEVWNRISVKCEVKELENLVESPLDDDDMTSPYTNRQKYLTTYSTDIANDFDIDGFNAFQALLKGEETTHGGSTATDWYAQVWNHEAWRFGPSGWLEDLTDGNSHQERLLNAMTAGIHGALIAFGKVERKADRKDNSPTARIEMSRMLAVSVNGNGIDTETGHHPNAAELLAASPVATYTGNLSGGVYSPADEETTNYIVISGSVVLNPVMAETVSWPDYRGMTAGELGDYFLGDDLKTKHHLVGSRTCEHGRYLTRRWWAAATPTSEPSDSGRRSGLVPYTGDGPEEYEFKYSAIGDGTDTVSKVGVLACMLIIGDKCCVETGIDGQPGDFEWKTYKERSECADDDEYYAQSFTIGFDPKIGDKLIGTEHKIQNNIDYTMGLEAEGMAIPVRMADKVSGQVRFVVLGPVNTTWDEVTRRHKTWFRSTKWGVNAVPLMAHVSTIYVKAFEVKLYSDNGKINNADGSDLIYMSDTAEDFVNEKDDITMRLNSALTAEERRALGLGENVRLSVPLDRRTGNGLLTVRDTGSGETGKPEQLYVDAYYAECHEPRVELRQRVRETGEAWEWNSYRHPALAGKRFRALGVSRNLMEDYAELKLRETKE